MTMHYYLDQSMGMHAFNMSYNNIPNHAYLRDIHISSLFPLHLRYNMHSKCFTPFARLFTPWYQYNPIAKYDQSYLIKLIMVSMLFLTYHCDIIGVYVEHVFSMLLVAMCTLPT